MWSSPARTPAPAMQRRRLSQTRTVRSNLQPRPGAPDDSERGARRGGPGAYLADNRLKTTKYTALSFLPKNLFEQFHRLANVYFVFIALLNFVPAVNAFQPGLALAPVLFILAATAIKDLWEDYSRHRSDQDINHLGCLVFSREERRYVARFWKEICVGDFVFLRCNDVVPADILLLASSDPGGLCHIETANLDGESNLKRRRVVRGFSQPVSKFNPLTFTSVIECEKPNNDLTRFRGCIIDDRGKKVALHKENLLLRGCTMRNTEGAAGIVVYAGHETKSLLNSSGPRYKRSRLERQMNRHVLCCVLILVCMAFVSAVGHWLWIRQYQEKKTLFDVPKSDGSDLSPATAAVYSFLTMVIVLQVLIPISLYVSIEIVKVCQVYFLNQDLALYDEETSSRLQCRALNITEDLGQIQYIFSDKTGTLTENKMVFRRCTVSGVEYSHDANAQRLARYQEMDLEEEDVLPRGSSLPQPSSLDNPQTLHRSHSTGSHCHPGFRAEGHRASVQSHTAFSSPMEKDITPDPKLLEKLSECDRCLARARHHDHPLANLSPELLDIFDFFIALTICNTVMVTAPEQAPQKEMGVKFELRSRVKMLEDFLRRLSPSRLTLGASSCSLNTQKADHKPGATLLSSLHNEGQLLDPPSATTIDSYTSSSSGPEHWQLPPQVLDTESTCEHQLRYEAESPDEAALVYAARAYRCTLVGRRQDQLFVELPQLGRLTFELLHTLDFDSIRKRMSVVVRHPLTQEINVYTKGADSVIMDLLLPCSTEDSRARHQKKIRGRTQAHLTHYARDGLRTLCIAKRVLSKAEYSRWLKGHLDAEAAVDHREELLARSAGRLETGLQLLGATGVEDRLQDGVPDTIAALRGAGLQIWVLTGDKQETALNIAHACQLLGPNDEVLLLDAQSQEACSALLNQCLQYMESRAPNVSPCKTPSSLSVAFSSKYPLTTATPVFSHGPCLVIDGKCLAFALEKNLEDKFLFLAKQCRSVLCCRSTPLQKSMVVKLVRSKLKAMTLAIGDGANDVSMIQMADVGVGISGQEGMQAVMASDFALPRFRYLERLLIVHGHWCYSRLANMVLYFFYKNTMFVCLLFWFQFFCGFSASAMIDQWYLVFFNLLFSSLPQLVTGVLDKDVPAHVLLAQPQLYRSRKGTEEYGPCTFWLNMLDAAFQSLVCFFIPYLAYYDSDTDLFAWGTPITAIALFTFLLHLGIETKTWTWLNWVTCIFSVALFFSVAFIYNSSCPTCYPPSNPHWTIQTLMGTPLFYLTCLLAPVAALLPRLFFKALQGTLSPTPLQRGRQLAKKLPMKLPSGQSPLEEESRTEPSELSLMGAPGTGSQDSRPPEAQPDLPTWSSKTNGEPSAEDTCTQDTQDEPLQEELGVQVLGASTQSKYPGLAKAKRPRLCRSAAAFSIFRLPGLTSLLSLLSLGNTLQIPQSPSQMDKQEGEFQPKHRATELGPADPVGSDHLLLLESSPRPAQSDRI